MDDPKKTAEIKKEHLQMLNMYSIETESGDCVPLADARMVLLSAISTLAATEECTGEDWKQKFFNWHRDYKLRNNKHRPPSGLIVDWMYENVVKPLQFREEECTLLNKEQGSTSE